MEEILKLMQQHYQKWEQDPQRESNGYTYEKTFTEMWQKLGKEVLQKSVGKLPNDKNVKKNFKPTGGK
jgi:hypothetical protein